MEQKKIVISFFLSLLAFSFLTQKISAQMAWPPKEPVDYTMPYPGLLPDNPLYPLKILRDQFVTFLISDPVKKSEFDLLQADKHIQAGYLLIVKEKKVVLATTTISKGNNYFDQALTSAEEAKKQGMDTRDILQRLSQANQKHAEIIADLLAPLHGSDRQGLKAELLRTQAFQKRIAKLSKQEEIH